MSDITIGITGGLGFIGQATMEAAHAMGFNAVALDRPDNIMDRSLYKLTGVDRVIHLAGVLGTSELFDDPFHAVDVNVHGTLRVLEFCRETGARYTGITMPPAFPSVYSATKVCADRLASAWYNAYGVPVSRVRAFNAYGPGQKHGKGHPRKIIPTFATEAWAGRPIPIWGDGKQLVDLIHVKDVGKMLVDASNFGHDETFDAGTGIGLTVSTIAEFVLTVTGSKAGVEHYPMRMGEVLGTEIRAEGEGWPLVAWEPDLSWEDLAQTITSYKPQ